MSKDSPSIVSLVIGKRKSVGFPGKNVMKINGFPSCEYAFMASKKLKIKKMFVSTDCPIIKKIGKKYNAIHINRPKILALPDSLTEDVLKHAYNEIKKICSVDIVVLLFANNPAISIELAKKGIKKLKNNSSYDSAFSVCKYNMFSPARARKLKKNQIKSFVNLKHINNVSSIRSSQGDVYFCDLSVQIIKGRVFENMDKGMQPFQWMGRKSYPLINSYGFDIDEKWQKVAVELWLKENWNYKKKN